MTPLMESRWLVVSAHLALGGARIDELAAVMGIKRDCAQDVVGAFVRKGRMGCVHRGRTTTWHLAADIETELANYRAETAGHRQQLREAYAKVVAARRQQQRLTGFRDKDFCATREFVHSWVAAADRPVPQGLVRCVWDLAR